MMQEKPRIGVGVIVIDNDKVLLGKRKGTHGAGDWSFAGGHLEFLETPEECARRELLEETGLKATMVIPGPWTNDIIEGNKHYVTIFMIVPEFLGTPETREPHKCEGWHWFEWTALPSPLFLPIQTLLKNGFDHKAISIGHCISRLDEG